MRCDKVKKNLTAFLDGELPEKLQKGMEKHLAECASCKQEKTVLERVQQTLERMEVPPFESKVSPEMILEMARSRALAAKKQGSRALHQWLVPVPRGWQPALALATVLVAVGVWRAFPFFRALPLPTSQEIYVAERIELFDNLELIQNLAILEMMEVTEGLNGETG